MLVGETQRRRHTEVYICRGYGTMYSTLVCKHVTVAALDGSIWLQSAGPTFATAPDTYVCTAGLAGSRPPRYQSPTSSINCALLPPYLYGSTYILAFLGNDLTCSSRTCGITDIIIVTSWTEHVHSNTPSSLPWLARPRWAINLLTACD
jgi:hypothetical protein